MIFWNYNSPLTLIACLIWNSSEYFNVPLGRLAPMIFGLAIGSKGSKNKKS